MDLGNYHIEQLYIKLDKKLTLKAKRVILPTAKASPSFQSVDKTFDQINYLLTFFDTIALDEVRFSNNRIAIGYADQRLHITTKAYEIVGGLHRNKRIISAHIDSLHLVQHDINITGDLHYDIKKEKLSTSGHFRGFGIDGGFEASKRGEEIVFALHTKQFENLRRVIDLFSTLSPAVRSWIVDRIEAKHYTLQTFSGRGKLDKAGAFHLDTQSLQGEALLEQVKIHFQEGLDPIVAKKLHIHYHEGGLYFGLDAPIYKRIDLAGSTIAIPGLTKGQAHLQLDLKLKAPVDSEVEKILQSYHIDLPIRHTGHYAKVVLKINLPLKKRTQAKRGKVKVFVHVDLEKGVARYGRILLPIEKGWVAYDTTQADPLEIHATLTQGDLKIGKVILPLLSGKLHYTHNKIALHQVHLKEPWIDAIVDGSVDPFAKKAKLSAMIKALEIGTKKRYVALYKKRVPLLLDYRNGVVIDIPTLDLQIKGEKQGVTIYAKRLERLKSYIKVLPFDIEGGRLKVRIGKHQTYDLAGELKSRSGFFYEKRGACLSRIPFDVHITPKGVVVEAFAKRLRYVVDRHRIDIRGLHVDLKKLLQLYRSPKRKHATQKRNTLLPKKLIIIGKNSTIRYGKYRLVTDSYDVTLTSDGSIEAIGSTDGNIVKFSKRGAHFALEALRVTDRLLHPLIHFRGLQGGRYSISLKGNPDTQMQGHIIVEGGVLKDFKAYNNALAFLNTIPALATLQDPGFSNDGFKIEAGVIDYHHRGDKVWLDSIYIKGGSATIAGTGSIDLKRERLDVSLAIRTARELGKIVGNLPLLGYIIMGKDKSLTLGLKVKGTISHPKVETSALKGILFLPLEILKRTLESPAHIINQ